MEVEERMDESTDQRTDELTDEWTMNGLCDGLVVPSIHVKINNDLSKLLILPQKNYL